MHIFLVIVPILSDNATLVSPLPFTAEVFPFFTGAVIPLKLITNFNPLVVKAGKPVKNSIRV